MRDPRFLTLFLILTVVAGLAPAGPAGADPTCFRMSELYLRDPHTWVAIPLFGCRDVTDVGFFGTPSINDQLNENITTDGDGDGYLDLNALLIFDPFDPAAPGGDIVFHMGRCTAPMAGTTCGPDTSVSILRTTYTNGTAGTCLRPRAGTLRPYSPPVTVPGAPCFVTTAMTLPLDLGGIPIVLEGGQVAASYSGTPATRLVSGLLMGFLSEASADAITIPPEIPLIGGNPLSSVLAGGSGSCASGDDRDLGPDGVTPGWWFYLNFTADEVPFDASTSVRALAGEAGSPRFYPAMPNPSGGATTFAWRLESPAEVQLEVHDATGRRIVELAAGPQSAGVHHLEWDGLDAGGGRLPAGVYFATLRSAGETHTQKLLISR